MAGTLEKRGEDSWRLMVSQGFDSNGKRIRHTRTIKATSKREADKALALFVAEVERGLVVDFGRITLKEFVERWLRDYAETNLAPKTLYRYKQMLDSRIIPALGHLKLERIKPVHLMEFYKNLQEDGTRAIGKCTVTPEFDTVLKNKGLKLVDLSRLSGVAGETIRRARTGTTITLKTAQALSSTLGVPLKTLFTNQDGKLSDQTIKHHHRLISSILKNAVEWQMLTINPASRVKPPKVTKKKGACYDEEQTVALLKAVSEESLRHQVLIGLAIATGLRLGELMGLEWNDINFKDNSLRVQRSSQWLPGVGIFTKEPKTETSKRVISVPGTVMVMLNKLKVKKPSRGSLKAWRCLE
jgi:integrase